MPRRIRRLNPPQFERYQRYKPYLRRDFAYACVYCGLHENEHGGPQPFTIDHLRPKSRFPKLRNSYFNLLYACSVCNRYKADDWPSDNPLADGKGYLDPYEHDYDEHFAVDVSFQMISKTPVGSYMVDRLRLNRTMLMKLRQLRQIEEDQHNRFVGAFQAAIDRFDALLENTRLAKKKRRQLEADRTALQTAYNQHIVNWNRRWEPRYELEDY
jgi:hypothetical protein